MTHLRGPYESAAKAWIIVAVMAVFSFFLLAIFAFVMIVKPHPHWPFGRYYTAQEQAFLTHVKQEAPGWPNDRELVSEGHQVCEVLDTHHGNRDLVEENPLFGQPTMPSFMWHYNLSQKDALVNTAAEDLCPRWALYIGGTAI